MNDLASSARPRITASSPHSASARSTRCWAWATVSHTPLSSISRAWPRSGPCGIRSISASRKSVSRWVSLTTVIRSARSSTRPVRAGEPSGVRARASSASSSAVSVAPRSPASRALLRQGGGQLLVGFGRGEGQVPDPVLRSADDLGQPSMHLLAPDRGRRLPRRRSQQRVPRTGPPSLGKGDEPSAGPRVRPAPGRPGTPGRCRSADRPARPPGAPCAGRRAGRVTRRPRTSAISPGTPSGLPGIGDAALQQRPADLEDEERVAARLLMDQPQHARVQGEVQVVPEHPSGLPDAERPWLDLAQVPACERAPRGSCG